MKSKQIIADISLVLVALVWGSSFHFVHDALSDIGSAPLLAIRFLLASVFLLPFCKPLRWHPGGLEAGTYLFLGFMFQTIGLTGTTPGKAAFITGLNVILVPVFVTLKTKKLPSPALWTGVILAAIGIGLLTLEGSLLPGKGDLLVFLCAISFALQVIAVDKAAEKIDPKNLTLIQLGVCTFLSFGLWGIAGGKIQWTMPVFWALLITAVPATTIAFLVQTWAQKFTTPTRVGLAFSTEPVFAAIFSKIYGDEIFTIQKLIGCVLVFGGILLSELLSKDTDSHQEQKKKSDAACGTDSNSSL